MKKWCLFIVVIIVAFGSCKSVNEYKEMRTACRKMCEEKQDDNIGAKFFYSSFEATFGECKCYSRNGDVKKFYISNKDIRRQEWQE